MDAILRLVLLIPAVVVVGGLAAAGGVSRCNYLYGFGVAPEQPVPFSHGIIPASSAQLPVLPDQHRGR